MDVLSSTLSRISLQSTLLARFRASGDWAVDCGSSFGITSYSILDGECWLVPADGESRRLRAGDILVLTEGQKHVLCSCRSTPPIALTDVADSNGATLWNPENPLGSIVCLDQVGKPGTEAPVQILLCVFRAEQDQHKVITNCLPESCHLSAADCQLSPMISHTLSFIAREVEETSIGFSLASHKLAELFLVQLLRSLMASQGDRITGWLKALNSTSLSSALTEVHQNPHFQWTVANLANLSGMSRSAFAAEFTRVVAEPPMAYVRRLRIQAAAELLKKGRSVKEAAELAGYATPFGFQKAFKSIFGQPPGKWRHHAQF